MGMACGLESGSCSPEDLRVARSLVPKALEPYVTGQRPGGVACLRGQQKQGGRGMRGLGGWGVGVVPVGFSAEQGSWSLSWCPSGQAGGPGVGWGRSGERRGLPVPLW